MGGFLVMGESGIFYVQFWSLQNLVTVYMWVVLPKNMAVLEKVPKGRPQISITKGGSLKKLIGNRNGAAPQAQIR